MSALLCLHYALWGVPLLLLALCWPALVFVLLPVWLGGGGNGD